MMEESSEKQQQDERTEPQSPVQTDKKHMSIRTTAQLNLFITVGMVTAYAAATTTYRNLEELRIHTLNSAGMVASCL